MPNIRERFDGVLATATGTAGKILHRVADAVDPAAAARNADFAARERLAEFKARRRLVSNQQDMVYREIPSLVADTSLLYLLGGPEAADQNPHATQLVNRLEQRTVLLESQAGVPLDYSSGIIQAAMRQAEEAGRTALRLLVNQVGIDRFAHDMVTGVNPDTMAQDYLAAAVRNSLPSGMLTDLFGSERD